MTLAPEPIEPKHPIEQRNFSLFVLSNKGELKPREEPCVDKDLDGGTTVFLDFEAVPGQGLRLFVRHDSPVDASADISFEGRPLGKWSIARESKVWHNIASDSLFKFRDSYDQSKVFAPSTFEIRFQYLSRVARRLDRDVLVLVPTAMREPSLEDGPGWVRPSEELMQSQFESVEDDPFLTLVISMHPPPATSSPLTMSSPLTKSSLPTSSSLLTTSTSPMMSTLSTTSTSFTTSALFSTSTTSSTRTATSELITSSPPATPTSLLTTSSLPTTSSVSTTNTSYTTSPPTTPTIPMPGSPLSSPIKATQSFLKPAANPEPDPASTLPLPSESSPATSLSSLTLISSMSDDELQEALSEYGKTSLLLPPRLIPGFRGKLSIEDFCRRYELPEDTPPLLAQMGIKDAHGLSSKRLSDLRDKGMAPRSIKMLRLAVIRFSSESGP